MTCFGDGVASKAPSMPVGEPIDPYDVLVQAMPTAFCVRLLAHPEGIGPAIGRAKAKMATRHWRRVR